MSVLAPTQKPKPISKDINKVPMIPVKGMEFASREDIKELKEYFEMVLKDKPFGVITIDVNGSHRHIVKFRRISDGVFEVAYIDDERFIDIDKENINDHTLDYQNVKNITGIVDFNNGTTKVYKSSEYYIKKAECTGNFKRNGEATLHDRNMLPFASKLTDIFEERVCRTIEIYNFRKIEESEQMTSQDLN
jgi:hypothetical protein